MGLFGKSLEKGTYCTKSHNKWVIIVLPYHIFLPDNSTRPIWTCTKQSTCFKPNQCTNPLCHLCITRNIITTWQGMKRTLWVLRWWVVRCCSARLAVRWRKMPTSSTKLAFCNLWPIPWTINTRCRTGTFISSR